MIYKYFYTVFIGISLVLVACAKTDDEHLNVTIDNGSAASKNTDEFAEYRNADFNFNVQYPASLFTEFKEKMTESMDTVLLDYEGLKGDQIARILPIPNCYNGPDKCEENTKNISLTFIVIPASFDVILSKYDKYKSSIDEFEFKGHKGFSMFGGGEGVNYLDRYIDLDSKNTLWIQTYFNADEIVGVIHDKESGFIDMHGQTQLDKQIFESLSFQ